MQDQNDVLVHSPPNHHAVLARGVPRRLQRHGFFHPNNAIGNQLYIIRICVVPFVTTFDYFPERKESARAQRNANPEATRAKRRQGATSLTEFKVTRSHYRNRRKPLQQCDLDPTTQTTTTFHGAVGWYQFHVNDSCSVNSAGNRRYCARFFGGHC